MCLLATSDKCYNDETAPTLQKVLAKFHSFPRKYYWKEQSYEGEIEGKLIGQRGQGSRSSSSIAISRLTFPD